MGAQIVDAIKAANKPFMPIADADIGAFVAQLLNPTDYPGLVGAAVTNTASVGGAGVNLAYKLLTGQPVTADRGAAGRTPSCSTRRSWTTRPTRARPPSRRGSPSPTWTRSGPLACRSRAGPTTTRPRSRHPARAPRQPDQHAVAVDAGSPGSTATPSPNQGSDDPHRDRPAARGHRRLQDVRRRRRARSRVARRATGRGPRADGRQRRRQEHVRQDPHRRGHDPTAAASSCAAANALHTRRPTRAANGLVSVYQEPARHPRSRHPRQPAADLDAGGAVPPLAERAGPREPGPVDAWRGGCRWRRSGSSTWPARWRSSRTCCCSTRSPRRCPPT